MKIILFAHKDSLKTGAVLKKALEQNFQEIKLHVFKTFNSFKSNLKQGTGNSRNEILILLVDSIKRLDQLVSLADLMEGKRILMVLPDDSHKCVSKALRFSPRFFISVSDSYDDLCDVIDKMIDENKRQAANIVI
jgi:hypothetical protein